MSREDANIFEQLYRTFQKKITIGNGVVELLDYCKNNNVFIAILTNGRPEPQQVKVVALDLQKWFDNEHIFISGGIGYQKPDPQAFKYIENAFGLDPEETWYVGDTYVADVIGANTAGWHTIWFNHRNKEDRKSTRLNSSHRHTSRMPSSA